MLENDQLKEMKIAAKIDMELVEKIENRIYRLDKFPTAIKDRFIYESLQEGKIVQNHLALEMIKSSIR